MGSTTTKTVAEMPEFQKEFLTDTLIPVAKGIADQPYEAYTGDRVAGLTDLQTGVLEGYGQLSTPSPLSQRAGEIYTGLGDFTPQQMQAAQAAAPETAASRMADYTNPYEQQVIDAALRDVGSAQQMAMNKIGAQAGAAGAFGGSRHGIAEAETNKAYQQQALDTAAKLRAQGFNTALGASQFDVSQARSAAEAQAAREQAARAANMQAQFTGAGIQAGAAGGLAGLGSSQLRDTITALGAQMGAGEAERALTQQGLDIGYQDYLARMNYPLTQFGVLTGAASSIPGGYGTTTQTQRNPMAGIGMGLQALGGFGMAGMGPLSGLGGGGITSNPFSF